LVVKFHGDRAVEWARRDILIASMRKAIVLGLVVLAAGAGWKRMGDVREQLSAQCGKIRESWSAAEAALRNRVPVLEDLAEHASPEVARRVREATAKLAAASGQGGMIAASSAIDDAVARWLVEVEGGRRRPELDALKDRLRESEFRFATERRKYNSDLQKYNVSLELFPTLQAAKLFGFVRDDAYFITELPGQGASPVR
jgi:hypothetical protein